VSRDTIGGQWREVVSGFPPKSYYTRICDGGQTPVGRERERKREKEKRGRGKEGGVRREDGVSSNNTATK